MDYVELAADAARTILDKIPVKDKTLFKVVTRENGDPIVFYEYRDEGYYKVVSERGSKREELVAKNKAEMTEYFIDKAIWKYALDYELKHRRYFEDNLRQTHEVMEWCYMFLDGRKIVRDHYNDEIHIILDLLFWYKKECKDIINTNTQSQEVACLCKYIIENKYADSPNGGMSDPLNGLKKAHEVMVRIQECLSSRIDFLDKYEKIYNTITCK